MKHVLLSGLLTGASVAAAAQTGPATELKPFVASYAVTWRGMNAGTSELKLERQPDGNYLYSSRSNASGLFRLVLGGEIVQTSLFELAAEGVRPLRYRADDGSSDTDRDISLDFDWQAARITGVAEDEPVDIQLPPHTQDDLSIQMAVAYDLQHGSKPALYRLADKNKVKEYQYASEGEARLKTAMGELDTVIYRSQRTGSQRVTRTWLAPSLGFLPVRAEQIRNGKREWLMEVRKLQRS